MNFTKKRLGKIAAGLSTYPVMSEIVKRGLNEEVRDHLINASKYFYPGYTDYGSMRVHYPEAGEFVGNMRDIMPPIVTQGMIEATGTVGHDLCLLVAKFNDLAPYALILSGVLYAAMELRGGLTEKKAEE
jgi:hypothetical protein